MPTATSRLVLLAAVLCGLAGCGGPTQVSAPGSHRLVYRVEDLAQGPVRVTTEVMDVASPQRARKVVHAGNSAAGTSLGGVAYAEEHLYLLRADGTSALVQDIAPTFAGPAWQLRVTLEAALAHRLAVRLNNQVVGGRTCTQWRTFAPLDAGPVLPANAAESAVSCVTVEGLLVQETWSIDGKVVRRRALVSEGAGPSLEDDGLLGAPAPTATPAAPPQESVKDVGPGHLATALGIPAPRAPLALPARRTAAVIQLEPDGAGVAVEGGVFSWGQGERLVVLRIERGLTRRLMVGREGFVIRAGARSVLLQPVSAGVRLMFAGPQGLVATVTTNRSLAELLPWVATLSLG